MPEKKMLPIIFKEQLNRLSDAASSQPKLSLVDYKIDFDDALGEGCYGRVWGVIKRPENEKGFFSRSFPCQYDFLFRVDASEKQTTDWCVKISKPILESVILKERSFNAAIFEKSTQFSSHLLRQKYKITNICFPETSNYGVQFKSRVKGNTLDFYLNDDYVTDPKNYHFRKAYVSFLWAIMNVPIQFNDLHLENLMYDEVYHQIEIVDSSAKEVDKRGKSPIYFEKAGGFYYTCGALTEIILLELKKAAEESSPYSMEFDQCLLAKVKSKKTSNEFHCLYDFYGSNLFLLPLHKRDLEYTVMDWKLRNNRASLFEKQTLIKLAPEEKAELFLELERRPTNLECITAALKRIMSVLDVIESTRRKNNPDSSFGRLTIPNLTPEEKIELFLDLERKPTDIKHMSVVLERIIKSWVGFFVPLENLTITNILTPEEITELFSELQRKPTELERRTAALKRIVNARPNSTIENMHSPEEKADKIIHRTVQFNHYTMQQELNASSTALNAVSMFNKQDRIYLKKKTTGLDSATVIASVIK